jgi:putative DNA primase/helicase
MTSAHATAKVPSRGEGGSEYRLPAGLNLYVYRPEQGGVLDLWRHLHGQDWLYVTGYERWYAWTGTHWERDEQRAIQRQVQDLLDAANCLARSRLQEASRIEDEDTRSVAGARAQVYIIATTRTRNRIDSIVEMARNLCAVPASSLNAGNCLNLANGVLNLDTYELRAHVPGDRFAYCLPYAYDPTATCPRWEQFIAEVLVHEPDAHGRFQPDAALADLYRELFGISLTTETWLETMVWQLGEGENGKSVAMRVLRQLLGPLATPVNFHTLGLPGNYDLAQLAGVRVAFSTEGVRERGMQEDLLKQIVSGEEVLARPIYGQPFAYRSALKVWWSMNDPPVVKDSSRALWRRLALIPFRRSFSQAERDTQLGAKLEAELPGILNWALAGLQRLRANGRLTEVAAVRSAVEDVRREASPIAQWLGDRTVRSPEACTGASTLYGDYCDWCRLRGQHAVSMRSFGVGLSRLGVAKKRAESGVFYALETTRELSHHVPAAPL